MIINLFSFHKVYKHKTILTIYWTQIIANKQFKNALTCKSFLCTTSLASESCGNTCNFASRLVWYDGSIDLSRGDSISRLTFDKPVFNDLCSWPRLFKTCLAMHVTTTRQGMVKKKRGKKCSRRRGYRDPAKISCTRVNVGLQYMHHRKYNSLAFWVIRVYVKRLMPFNQNN